MMLIKLISKHILFKQLRKHDRILDLLNIIIFNYNKLRIDDEKYDSKNRL